MPAKMRRWLRQSGTGLVLRGSASDASKDNSNDNPVRVPARNPVLVGSILICLLVIAFLIWASFFSVAGAVLAPGSVRVENSSKQIKSREGGTVRAIFVHEGDLVSAGQSLIRFDRVQNQASVDIYQAQYDSLRAEIARYQAEASNHPIRFPPDLIARQSDPQISALISGQRDLFYTHMAIFSTQSEILNSQAQQVATQISGMKSQMNAIDTQSGLINDELSGVRDLNAIGYAPRTRLLELQRNVAVIEGQRGALVSDMARATQSIGEIRIQKAQLTGKRESDAAQGLRDAQDKVTEVIPHLRANQQDLFETEIRAPVSGYVFNLTQFTVGGVAQPGEMLMQIVPNAEPLIITAQVRPNEIAEVRRGMRARVTLTAYNPQTTPQIDGRVILVGADAITDPQTHISYYQVEVKIDPQNLAKAGPEVRLTPGMPATVAIITGSRTVMDYLIGPMTQGMRTALRER